MIEKLLIGILGVSSMMIAWIGVQTLWRRTFADHIEDRDVLAGRSDCGNCSCVTPCSVKKISKNKMKV